MNRKDVKKYHDEMMRKLERQLEEANEPPKYSSENFQEEEPSVIERLREYNYNEIETKKLSKSSMLENLKIKYPYVDSPRNPYRDRDQMKQYWKLVSTKNLKVAEFVLKWEHVHEKRIHKDMAWELLTEIIKNEYVSDNFFQYILEKYECYD